MFNLLVTIPTLPLAHWIDSFVDWLTQFAGFFGVLTNFIGTIVNAFQAVFDFIPIWLFIILIMALTWYLKRGQKYRSLLIFELVGLLLIWNLGFWRDMTQTLTFGSDRKLVGNCHRHSIGYLGC